MSVALTAERDLTPEQARAIAALQLAAFPGTPEFQTQRWWHTPHEPDELWFTAAPGGLTLGGVRVIHRAVDVGGRRLLVAGIGNVCSHPDHRGQGLASQCMQAVTRYIAGSGKVDYGLLFCGQKVRDFYARLNWRQVANDFVDARGVPLPALRNTHACVMILPGRRTLADWPDGGICLNGPDW